MRDNYSDNVIRRFGNVRASDWLKKCAITAKKVCNVKIIAHFSIGKTAYKINKYMIITII